MCALRAAIAAATRRPLDLAHKRRKEGDGAVEPAMLGAGCYLLLLGWRSGRRGLMEAGFGIGCGLREVRATAMCGSGNMGVWMAMGTRYPLTRWVPEKGLIKKKTREDA
jgi:hypothetical protein